MIEYVTSFQSATRGKVRAQATHVSVSPDHVILALFDLKEAEDVEKEFEAERGVRRAA
jgi:hypothetical protein